MQKVGRKFSCSQHKACVEKGESAEAEGDPKLRVAEGSCRESRPAARGSRCSAVGMVRVPAPPVPFSVVFPQVVVMRMPERSVVRSATNAAKRAAGRSALWARRRGFIFRRSSARQRGSA